MLRFLFRNLRARFRDQRQEIRALAAHIRPGEIAADIGANKGSYLFWLSRLVGSRGQVVAFEPQARLADDLQQNVRRVGLRNVVVERLAVSDACGTARFHRPEPDSPGARVVAADYQPKRGQVEAVQTITLDHYFARRQARVAALKIDVEGHEPAVFRGAERLIAEDAPLLVFECEDSHLKHTTVDAVLMWLAVRDYDGWFIHRQRLVPVSAFDARRHQPRHGPKYYDHPDYCNNFVLRRAA